MEAIGYGVDKAGGKIQEMDILRRANILYCGVCTAIGKTQFPFNCTSTLIISRDKLSSQNMSFKT